MRSIRVRLTILFLATIVFPVVVIIIAIPSYYQQLIVDKEATQTERTLISLNYGIETYLDDLERMTIAPYMDDEVMWALKLKASSYKYERLTPYEQNQAERSLSFNLPNALKNMRKDILGTILLPMDHSVYMASSNGYSTKIVEGFPFEAQDWYKQAIQQDGKVAFISVHKQDYIQGEETEVFSVARLIKDPDSQRPLGVIMADAHTGVLEKMIKGIKLDREVIAAIMDNKGKLIYASSPLDQHTLDQLNDDKLMVSSSQEKYRVVGETISRSDWRIVVLFPESVTQKQLQSIYLVGGIVAVAGLAVSLVLYFTVSHWMVTPFKRMAQVMKRVQRGDLKASYPVHGNDEIAQLGQSLNTMIVQLSELIDSEFRAVLGQRNAEYRALQSQIQPHFLYNTLNSFIGLNRAGQTAVLERMILSLSSMMRYTLEQDDWATLKEEVAFITRYCDLQQMRFNEKLDVNIYVSPDIPNIPIPKLLLQPIVENAFVHGIEPSAKKCLLSIHISIQPGMDEDERMSQFVIRISDDGAGFNSTDKREGVGMKNVRERLQLAYEDSSIEVYTVLDQGTDVFIKIPFKDVNNE
ncbi:sensor histidine kinase [Paenibacillus sp. NPDC058071]|uniref:cache domain-containing sensor histidine kinase n=1 Tax=Paenibacillus sp. NPDC058071 TaxID=3346326 RepID=UPI0036DB3198